MRSKTLLAAIVLTHNEENHICRLMRSVEPLGMEVYVVDSFSTDNTVSLAKSMGACVVQHKFVNHAQQFQWALDNISIQCEWVMRLDADEVLTSELVREILRELPLLLPDVNGVNLKRRHIFLDRWIRYGGRYPLILLRIWRRGAAKVEQRWMDEHMVLLSGHAVTFEHDFCDHNLNDLFFFTDKHNKYATREAIDRLNHEFELFPRDEAVAGGASSSQSRLKRLVKEGIYNRLPFGVGPVIYFIWRYFFQLGICDGPEGLIYHFLQGFWYRFLVEARVLELRRAVKHLRDKEEIRSALRKFTGLAIE